MLDDADGVKTGTTNDAGPCLVSSATRGNQRLIAVVLHDHSRWYDSMNLLKYGFDNFDLYEYAEADSVISSLPVEHGAATLVDAVTAGPAAIIVKQEDIEYVTVEVDLPETVNAPVYKGQKIGEIVFYVRNKAVKATDITVGQEVAEKTVTRTVLLQLLKMFRLCANWGVL